jgi:hypothetical protein
MITGTFHSGITVSEVVRMRSEAPQEVAAGANRGGWGLYVLDPDGSIVELHQAAA